MVDAEGQGAVEGRLVVVPAVADGRRLAAVKSHEAAVVSVGEGLGRGRADARSEARDGREVGVVEIDECGDAGAECVGNVRDRVACARIR